MAIELPRARRLVVNDLVHQHPRITAERKFARYQFKQNDAERIQVRAPVRRMSFSARLFGRHIGGRPKHLSVKRDRNLANFPSGQTKIHEVRLPIAIDQNVGRLEVAVDHAAIMSVLKGVDNCRADFGGLAHRGLLAREPIVERNAADEITDDVHRVAVASHLVHAHDIWMLKLSGRAGFSQKFFEILVIEPTTMRNLDGHRAVELAVSRFPNRAESSDSEEFDQVEVCQRLQRWGRQRVLIRSGKTKAAAANRACNLDNWCISRGFKELAAMRTPNLKHARRGIGAHVGRRCAHIGDVLGTVHRDTNLPQLGKLSPKQFGQFRS